MDDRSVMAELKALLEKNFPGNIDKVILYGSRVYGKAKKYSDYDVLIVLKHDYDWEYKYRIQDICWEIDYKFDILTDVKIVSIDDLNSIKGKQPYILNAMETGVSI